MTWNIFHAPTAVEALQRLDDDDADRIVEFLDMLATLDDPRTYGMPVSASWQYFVDEFALVAQIREQTKTIQVSLLYSVALNEAAPGKSHIFYSSSRYH
ncbi:MAG: hypothetical protein LBR05_08925 [Azoarcus sp.]|jgi:mRNA-degrading endonuclease RelE of RelBE toxin-antitoxin system|nr:hypothetical protein [Azoarcus sp.]